MQKILLAAAVAVFISSLAWWASVTAEMSGSWREVDTDALRSVLFETDFGKIWLARLGLSLLLFAAILRKETTRRIPLIAILAALLLASLGLIGHAAMFDGSLGAIHVVSQTVHLLCLGFWIGGLPPLAFVLSLASHDKRQGRFIVSAASNFSLLGYFAVSLIFASGLIMTAILVRPWSALLTSSYGNLVLMKMSIFFFMLLIAIYNRTVLLPALERQKQAPRRLIANIALETALGLAAIAAASLLGNSAPPIIM